jgi:hypothetical protein
MPIHILFIMWYRCLNFYFILPLTFTKFWSIKCSKVYGGLINGTFLGDLRKVVKQVSCHFKCNTFLDIHFS